MIEKLIYILEKFGVAEGIAVIIVLVIGGILWRSEIKFNISLKKGTK